MQLALVTDLDKCVGCDACQMSCKVWNTSGPHGPLPDINPWGAKPWSMYWLRVLHLEQNKFPDTKTTALPLSCFHCREPACVKVCPVGAMHKRPEDGVVLVDYDRCIGCRYCVNACPYGNVNFDPIQGVAKKCTLCIDRVYNTDLPEYERVPACVRSCPTGARIFGDIDNPQSDVRQYIERYDGFVIGPSFGTRPSNHYLPPRGPSGPDARWPDETRVQDFGHRSGAEDVITEALPHKK
ncbi:Sulfite dehydrogenase subunit B [Candidatus Hydrogenisulfobacillus filiaventi]|uniref:Sulfite dehydrogenase subunit B n=1 Tax=Candidatus Hydrogenisulfobacillus filiaventi TaxID=2707344 RepID=A0A6F8ZI33_9FIRM|nr:4Fe-4S dicluster domain-containing protein [Bacillota bacterium]CAB1129312.1 Sulfite dehydrogenase subunit B [Candidatus Hydrogenisulfobacillus filiaventi]